MKENNIVKLSEIEHVLKRPGQYIGSLDYCSKDMFIYENEKFVYKNITYIPGLDKCLNEILDNCLDEAIRTNFKYANKIEININSNHAEFIDNGRGVPCDKNDQGQYKLELAFNNARAGSNFNDDNRQTVGMNGVGSFCVNCFSKLFRVTTFTKTAKGELITKNNLSESKCNVKKYSGNKLGTTVYFEPDWEKFGIKEFDKIHIDLLYQRILNLSICFPQITFCFNGKKIKLNAKGFLKMFNDNALVYETDNILIGVIPNIYDDFKFYSYVNGIKLLNGGTHIDLISGNIISGLRDKLQRKCKGILPGDIKHKLSLVVFFRQFNNPKFNSQTKEQLTNSVSEINSYINNRIDFDKIIKDILKNDEIVKPIIDTFSIKEELKLKKELKSATKKKIKSDKFISAIGSNDYLIITEGDSAMGVAKALGRNGIAYYALGGVPPNAYDSSLQQIINYPKLKDLNNVLRFGYDSTECNDFSFKKLVIATDEDNDGLHINGLLFGYIYKFARNLFKEIRVLKLRTPLIVVLNNKNKIDRYFMSMSEYKEYEKTHKISGVIRYMKGLGSWKPEWLHDLIKEKSLDYFLQPFELGDKCEQSLNDWLLTDKEHSDKRKEYIQQYNLDINLV